MLKDAVVVVDGEDSDDLRFIRSLALRRRGRVVVDFEVESGCGFEQIWWSLFVVTFSGDTVS